MKAAKLEKTVAENAATEMRSHLPTETPSGSKTPNAVQSQSNAPAVESPNTIGFSVGSQLPNIGAEIKPVDRATIEGSYAGDSIERESQDFPTSQFKTQPGPRDATGSKGA